MGIVVTSWGFPSGAVIKNPPANAGDAEDMGLFDPWVVAQTVKHLPAMWETQVRSLGWEDPLEQEIAIYSSFLAWKIPWMEERGGLQSMRLQRVGHD